MRIPLKCNRRLLYGLVLLFFCRSDLIYAASLTGISVTTAPTVSIGSETQLSAVADYSDGSRKTITSLASWTSADPRTVSVTNAGIVTGLATGTVLIEAHFEGALGTTVVTSSLGDADWSGPIVITRGGTYSGRWKSTRPGIAAVTVATAAPVVIENSYVTGPSDLISDPAGGSNLTVKNVAGIAVNPNIRGWGLGLFVDAAAPASLTVENCYWEDVQFGVWVKAYAGNRNGTQTITIINNRGRNTLGVESDGNGGYLQGAQYHPFSHTIQISNVAMVPGIEIAWNELINYPYESLVNEVLSMYDSGGTASSHALIHDNYVQGAYGWNPPVDAYNGGGITTDGYGGDTVATGPAFNDIYDNQVVDTTGMGLELGAGHDNYIHNNKALSAGLLSNGTKIAAQNVGLTIFDNYGNTARGTMYNNNIYNNTVGWMCWDPRCAWDGYRSDQYYEVNSADYALNSAIPNNPVTLAQQSNEYAVWLNKIAAGHQEIGPTFSTVSAPPPPPPPPPTPPPVEGGSGPTPSTSAWYTIVNANSSMCLELEEDLRDGVRVRQNTCRADSHYQQWQFKAAGQGYYQITNRYTLAHTGKYHSWDVSGGPWNKALGTKIQIYSYNGDTNQQWMPVYLGYAKWKFVVRSSHACLDVPGATLDALAPTQQWACNGSEAQSYYLKKQ